MSRTTISHLLTDCRTISDIHKVHAHIIRRGYEQDQFLINRFISVCTTVEPTNVSYPTSIFNCVTCPKSFLWNILMKAPHGENFSLSECFSLFSRMRRRSNVVPDKYIFPKLIKACSKVLALREGRIIHGVAVRCGTDGDLFVGTSLIDLYGKCKEIESARKVFDGMSVRNVVSWTTMMSGYLIYGDMAAARCLFDEMPKRNEATWNVMIKGLVKLGDLKSARYVFDALPLRNKVSFTTLIDGYAKSGDMATARSLFDELPQKDLVSWSALISGYEQNGKPDEAVRAFSEMCAMNVKPDEFTMVSLMSACSQLGSLEHAERIESYMKNTRSFDLTRPRVAAALVDMNAKCGNMERATLLFEQMPKRDLFSYCSMMKGLCIHGRGDQAVLLFDRMIDAGIRPDDVAFTVILSACSHSGLLDDGYRFFNLMIDKYSIIPSPDHYACMVDLLGKSGKLKAAFELIQWPVASHAGAWGALLRACVLNCDADLGEVAGRKLIELEPQNAGNFVLLSNLYAESGRWLEVSHLRKRMSERGVRKIPGFSYVESNAL